MTERLKGTVKFYKESAGYGFCTRDDGRGDVFVHANELKRSGITEPLQSGDKIEFETEPVPNKGDKARDIKLIKAA